MPTFARADLDNFVGGLPEHGARKDGARALLTVYGFNLGGDLRAVRTALLDGLAIGLVLIFVPPASRCRTESARCR